jgi:hypothetical protein
VGVGDDSATGRLFRGYAWGQLSRTNRRKRQPGL